MTPPFSQHLADRVHTLEKDRDRLRERIRELERQRNLWRDRARTFRKRARTAA